MTTRDSSTIDGAPHAPNRRVSNAHGDLDEDGVIGHRVGQVVVDRAELRGDPSEKCGCAPVIGRDAARTLPFTAVHAALDAVDHLVGRSGAGGSLPRK
jgi:hypothetical protein